MSYVYALSLPSNLIKIGRSNFTPTHLMAQRFHLEKVSMLAVWQVDEAAPRKASALRACREWHVARDFYRVEPDPLALVHPLVARISGVLGAPQPAFVKPAPKPRGRKASTEPRELFACSKGHRAPRVAGNCTVCAREAYRRCMDKKRAEKERLMNI